MPTRALLAALPLVFLWPAARELAETRMAGHMLLQFPLLLAAGWAAAGWLPRSVALAWERLDAHGLTSATLASCVSAFWMLPVALDLSLLAPGIALLKYASWYATGLLLADGWRRLNPVVAAFFLGNAAWMLATAGLLYHEAEARLCVNYLVDDQVWTGSGLIAWALLLGGVAAWKLRPMWGGARVTP
jgi:hypothetical protein